MRTKSPYLFLFGAEHFSSPARLYSANVLMELRKTLCHPYLVEEALEHEIDVTEADQHRNLVEASSKLTFLSEWCTDGYAC